MFNEDIYTLDEVAKHLKVPVEAIQAEIASGRLRATHIAEYVRIRESDLNAFKGDIARSPQDRELSSDRVDSIVLGPVENFSHVWPDGKNEHFLDAREGVATYLGASYHIKIGFTTRESAGRKRKRSLVLINRYPTVEFVSADATGTGQMASIIRDRSGRQLPVGAPAPAEYANMRVGAYRDVVVGPGAPNGMAVICDPNEIDTMLRHGLIRYRYREERSQRRPKRESQSRP